MKKFVYISCVCLLICIPCRNAAAVRVNLTSESVTEAVDTGTKHGSKITAYLKQQYSFGNEDMFEEYGIIRSKWSKLAMLAGLLAARDKQPSEREINHITGDTHLQIDVVTYGNTIDFAEKCKVHLVQNGTIIEPEKTSATHSSHIPGKKTAASGFPKYRATVGSYFAYGTFCPDCKVEIVLTKDGKTVTFAVNLADYK